MVVKWGFRITGKSCLSGAMLYREGLCLSRPLFQPFSAFLSGQFRFLRTAELWGGEVVSVKEAEAVVQQKSCRAVFLFPAFNKVLVQANQGKT